MSPTTTAARDGAASFADALADVLWLRTRTRDFHPDEAALIDALAAFVFAEARRNRGRRLRSVPAQAPSPDAPAASAADPSTRRDAAAQP